MPLMKKPSKKAFNHNVKAEMDSGKPQDQALAIAYDVSKRNRKKMAKGGQVKSSADSDQMDLQKHPSEDMHSEYKQMMSHADDEYHTEFQKRPSMEAHKEDMAAMRMSHADEDSEMGDDMISSIMRKRYAAGGMIDLPAEEAEHANAYYPINEHDVVGKEWASNSKDYSDSGMDGMDEDYHSPKDMDEDHPDMAEDTFDHISRIMEKMHRRKR